MNFNINEFKAEINSSGITKTSLFKVFINRPNAPDIDTERTISMRCMATDLPGRTAMTSDYKIYNKNQKIAMEGIDTELTVQIILSEQHSEREYFEDWFDLVVGRYRTGVINDSMFSSRFYDEYIGNIDIVTYSETEEETYRLQLVEAYPVSIGQIALSWQNGNEFAILPITFTYKYYIKK